MDSAENYTDSEVLAWLRSDRQPDPIVRFLYRQYFGSLCNYIEQNTGLREDAEDIFQEVLVSFIELVKLNKFRGDSSIKTFLFAMNRNLWLNELKRRNRALAREKIFEKDRTQLESGTDELIAGREARNQVLLVVGQLGDTCRKILLGFYYRELAMKDILKETGYENEQVVRNKKYKCLKQLEQMIASDPSLAQSLKNALNYE